MSEVTAEMIMTTDLVTVHDTMSLAEVADLLVTNEISGAPVLDENEALVGVVSLTDIARASLDSGRVVNTTADPEFYLTGRVEELDLHGWEGRYDPEDMRTLHVSGGGLAVRDVMTRRVITVEPGASVSEVAAFMVSGHYHRVLVAEGEKLLGIVSSMDLLRLLADVEEVAAT